LIPTQRLLALAATLASLSLGHCAHAQHSIQGSQGETITLDAQGGDYPEWFQNPHMVELYALSVGMLRANAGRVDAAAYEQKSYEIFRAFARSLGADPDGMIDHLKAIPREMVAIVRDDPTVLDSYESFLVALRGPREHG
jgi:hypothetical protein